MSTYTIIPNQPLGWSSTIPNDECGCEKHQYCAPLLFEFSNYIYDAYVARAIADGAIENDLTPSCTEETINEFYRLSNSPRYLSEKFSFLYKEFGDVRLDCDNLLNILENEDAITFSEETDIVREDEPGYVAGTITFNTQGGGPEPIPQKIDFDQVPFSNLDCVNVFGVTIEPDEELDLPWEIIFENEYGDQVKIESSSSPNQGFSIVFELVVGPNGFSIDIPGVEGQFNGLIRIAQMYVECEFVVAGLITSEDSQPFGQVEVVSDEVTEIDDISYHFLTAQISLTDAQIDFGCGYIKVNSGCCCPEIFYSKCIKPITDDCHTVGIEYFQDVTAEDGGFAFGFYYPSATPGNELRQFMRVWGEIRNPQYDGEMTTYQDSLGRKNVVYAESREFRSFVINYSPEYVHNALRLACRHDNFILSDSNYGINAENFYTRSETYSPSWIRISKLAPVTLEVEKKTQNLVGGSSKTFCS